VVGVLIATGVIDESNAGGFGAKQAWLYVTILTVGCQPRIRQVGQPRALQRRRSLVARRSHTQRTAARRDRRAAGPACPMS
jgi:hypothetical protein